MTENNKSFTLDGKAYSVADLPAEGRKQLAVLQAAAIEIERLKLQLILAQTAQQTFTEALRRQLQA